MVKKKESNEEQKDMKSLAPPCPLKVQLSSAANLEKRVIQPFDTPLPRMV